MKRFWILVLIAGTAIVAMSAYHYLMRPSRGDPAPSFSLPAVDGSAVALESYRGSPLLLHFWATWCGVCRQELPALGRMAADLADEGLAVLGISEDGEGGEEQLRLFLRQYPVAFPILLDHDGAVADAYQSFGVPESFLIDQKGIIVWRRAGAIDWDDHDVRARIRSLVR